MQQFFLAQPYIVVVLCCTFPSRKVVYFQYMSSVFILLLLVSLVGLVWGLIAPHHIARAAKMKRPLTRAHAGLGFGILALLFIILAGITAPPSKPTANVTTDSSNTSSTQGKPSSSSSVTTKQETETQPIAFSTTDENDSSLAKGQTKTTQTGEDGVKTLTYSVTYTNGTQTSKTLVSSTVTTQPVNQVVEVGTYVAPAPQPTPTPAPAPAPAPTPSPSTSCYPLTNGGNCYEPGEYCRETDHGATGLAGDGKSIVCTDNNGWRWEPN
jgi:hypothetical protein